MPTAKCEGLNSKLSPICQLKIYLGANFKIYVPIQALNLFIQFLFTIEN